MRKFPIALFLCALSMAFAGESGSKQDKSGPKQEKSTLKHIDCSLSPLAMRSKKGTHPHIPSATVDSLNWSGYVAQNNFSAPTAGSVSSVYGTWTVPKLTATPDTSYTVIWVGIDGFSDTTVEQLGTAHDWIGGAQVNYAWFEMYPAGGFELVGFPVNVGDIIGAEAAYIGSNTFQLSITNYTQGVTTVVPTSYTQNASAQRSSAEWVVEAPYAGGILPLSNFGQVGLTNCLAVINGKLGLVNDPLWQYQPVNMITTGGAAKATTSALSPSKCTSSCTSYGSGFTVKWGHE